MLAQYLRHNEMKWNLKNLNESIIIVYPSGANQSIAVFYLESIQLVSADLLSAVHLQVWRGHVVSHLYIQKFIIYLFSEERNYKAVC